MTTNNCQSSNGRINIEGPNTSTYFSMMDKIPISDCSSFREALNGNLLEETLLSKAFFSNQNIQILQNSIRAGVYKYSKEQYIINPQDCDVLKSIMRAIYLQHSVNVPYSYTEQIKGLNQLVTDFCVKQIYGEIDGYIKYKRDVSSMYTLMSNPVLETTKDKVLELKKWF